VSDARPNQSQQETKIVLDPYSGVTLAQTTHHVLQLASNLDF